MTAKKGLEIDKRVLRSRQKVLRETYKMLSENGFSGVSIDAIAKNTGVAKTTIYRHWPSRTALLLEACSSLGVRIDPPDTGDLEQDLRILLTQVGRELQSARWSTMVPSIIDAAERDPEIAAVYKRFHEDLMLPYRTVLTRAQERGQVSGDLRISELLAPLIGGLFYRRWFSRESLSERYVNSVVRMFMRATRQT